MHSNEGMEERNRRGEWKGGREGSVSDGSEEKEAKGRNKGEKKCSVA